MKWDPNLDSLPEQPNLPQSYCPGCDLARSQWPERGYVRGNLQYCCEDCAETLKCSCADAHLGATSS